MAANVIEVTLLAKDLISGVLGKIKTQATGLDSTFTSSLSKFGRDILPNIPAGVLSQFGYLKSAIGSLQTPLGTVSSLLTKLKTQFGGVSSGADGATGAISGMFGNLLGANLATAGIDLLISKVRQLGGAIQDAAKIQTTILASSSDIGTNLGVPIDQAQQIVERMNIKIAGLAAALPGSTQGYTAVFNALGSAIAKQHRGNVEEFEKTAADITKRVGVLASIRNIDPSHSGGVIERLISGNGGFGELALNDILQKNAVFKQALIDGMAAMGIDQKQWQQLSSQMRLQIVHQALRVATPDSLIDSFNGTVDSMLESIKSNLFDPLIGIFGMLRKVPSAAGRSILDAVQGFLQAWMSFSTSLGHISKALGISFDPLQPLIAVIDFFADIGNSLAGLLDTDSPQMIMRTSLTGVNSWLNSLLSAIWSLDIGTFTTSLANAVNDFWRSFSAFWMSIDWFAVGRMVVPALLQAFRLLAEFLLKLDFTPVLKYVISLCLSLIKFLAGVILGALEGLIGTVGYLLRNAIISPIARIGDAVKSVWDGIISFFKGLYDTVSGWLRQVQPILQYVLSAVTNPVGTAVQAVQNAVPEPVKDAAKKVSDAVPKPIKDAAKAAVNSVVPSPIRSVIQQFTGNNTTIQNNPARPWGLPERPTQPLPKPEPATKDNRVSYFNPVINIQAQDTSDPDTIANRVVSAIASGYRSYLREQLA